LPNPDYILKFDVYGYAEDNFDRVAQEIRQGRTLKDFDDVEHLQKMTEASVEENPIA
jgi:hypothetical protein